MCSNYCKYMFVCTYMCHSVNSAYKYPVISVTDVTNQYPIYSLLGCTPLSILHIYM